MYRPLIGISVGDPSGIGPEITAKALALPEIYERRRPLVVAEAEMMKEAVRFSKLDLKIDASSSSREGFFQFGTIHVFDMKNIDGKSIRHKTVSADCGRASFKYVKKVIELAVSKEIDATVNGPINKEAINLAGFHYSGHTEIYAELTQTKDYAMMLVHDHFRVIHVSTHVSLREACDWVKKDRIYNVIKLGYDAVRKLGMEPENSRGRTKPSCWRKRYVRPGGDRRDRTDDSKGKKRRVDCGRTYPPGYRLFKNAGRPIRPCGRHVP